MISLPQQHFVSQVVSAIQTVLCDAPERLERSSGLIQRKRKDKVTGARLAQTLVLGWLSHPGANPGKLIQSAAEVGLNISEKGLRKRMNRRTATFLLDLLEVALAQVVMADPVSLPLLERFSAVCIEDSSTITLPAELADLFRGKGGKGSPAGCKLFARLDVLRGQLLCSSLQDGRCSDARSPLTSAPVPARTLHLRDRGFTNVPRWEEEQAREEWVLTYLRADVQVYAENGTPLDLLERLPHLGPRGTLQVLVGKPRLPMRLFFERVTEEVVAQRRKKLKMENQERGQVLSERVSELAQWSIAVTTVPNDMLSWEEAVVLLRLRWQIELLFKLWKQDGQLDGYHSSQPDSILCEMLAKLIGLLLQHWVLIVSCWHDPHRSLVKAAQSFRAHLALLSTALAGDWDLHEAVARLLKVIGGASPRLTMRGDAPGTSQLVMEGKNRWSSLPPRGHKRYRKHKEWKPTNRKKIDQRRKKPDQQKKLSSP
jgi:hypothetical protein